MLNICYCLYGLLLQYFIEAPPVTRWQPLLLKAVYLDAGKKKKIASICPQTPAFSIPTMTSK